MQTQFISHNNEPEKAMQNGTPHPVERLMTKLAREDGWTLKRIGKALGHISKQAVSQRIHKIHGAHLNPNRSRFNPRDVVRACDAARSLTQAARKLHASTEALEHLLSEYGHIAHYRKHWTAKKQKLLVYLKERRQRRLIREYRRMAHVLGHAPSIKEWNHTARTAQTVPYHTAAITAFGSWQAFQKASGFAATKRGGKRVSENEARKAELLTLYTTLCRAAGRTLSENDINALAKDRGRTGGSPVVPYASTFRKAFGSIRTLQTLAGQETLRAGQPRTTSLREGAT
jgi:hypothetical protein